MATQPLQRPLATAEFAEFRDLIHAGSGMWLEDSKSGALRDALMQRAEVLGFADYPEYLAVLKADLGEFAELMNLVTINETSFFRFSEQFDALRDLVMPELLGGNGSRKKRPLRVWSAGCSTGEEVYSVAIALAEAAACHEAPGFRVLGTDVSTSALEKARAARYSAKSLKGVPNHLRDRWFVPVGDHFSPAPELRDHCEFELHNLAQVPYPDVLKQSWDVIFCRNVTIYFRPETTQRAIEQFYDLMSPGGFLFLGHSETLTALPIGFETVQAEGAYLYRKPREGEPLSHLGGAAGRLRRAGAGSRTRPPAAGATSGAQNHPQGTAALRTESAKRLAAAASARRAHRLLEDGQPDEALRAAEELRALDQSDTEAQLIMAFAHADLGEIEMAAAEASRILEREPLAAAASYLLGTLHRDQGRIDEAEAQFRRTLHADGEFVLAHFALAGIFQLRGEHEQAIREYEHTLRELRRQPDGDWASFLGGFSAGLIAASCERGLIECRRVAPAKGGRPRGR